MKEQQKNRIDHSPSIEYRFQRLPKELYLGLRASVGWKHLSDRQVDAALSGCKAMVTAWDRETGEVVGMGRLVGDELVIMNIQDLIVRPDYHGHGIGSMLIKHLREKAAEALEPGEELMFTLMCAKGRERFYEKNGFIARPTPDLGPGMIMYLHEEDGGEHSGKLG